MIDSETLIKKISPYPKETLSSFIFRTAKNNLMGNLLWIIDKFNKQSKDPLSENMIDWIENGTAISELAEFIGVKEEELSKMTYSYTLKKFGLQCDDIYKCPWFIYKTVKCCPKCLKCDPFIRKDWCLSQSICCTEHQKYLIDRCANCNRELVPKAVIQGQCLCGKALYQMESQDVSSLEVIEYQNYLTQFLYTNNHLNYNNWINEPSTFFQAIEFSASWISLITNNKEIPSVDGFNFDGTSHARTRLKKTKSQSQSVVVYCLAHNLLKAWPESYYNLLSLTYINSEKKLEMFYKRAVKKHINTSMKSISLEFTKFLQLRLLNLGIDNQLLRMDEAKILIPRYKETAIGMLPNFQCSINNTKLVLFNSEDVINWSNNLNSLITKEELRKNWQTSAKATYSILINEIIDGVYQFNFGSIIAWGVPLHSLETFSTKLRAKSGGYITDKISLNKTFEWIGPDNAHLIIRGMLNGNLNYLLNTETLGNSFVSKSQCYFYIENILIKEAKLQRSISIRSLIFILGVKKSDILYWIEAGRLKKSELNIEAISFSSFNRFFQTYLTSYQLALKKHKTVKQILKLHSINKIEAVTGPHTGDGKRLLFLKENFN